MLLAFHRQITQNQHKTVRRAVTTNVCGRKIFCKFFPLATTQAKVANSGSGKGWSCCQTFYLRLRNPGCHTWMMASVSLVTVVQSNFCDRDFLIDPTFSLGLRSGKFASQSITSNFASWKSSSLFQMKDTEQYPIGIFLHHQEMFFSYLERLFSQLHQCTCINSSYLKWHKWSYYWKTKTSPEHLFRFLY